MSVHAEMSATVTLPALSGVPYELTSIERINRLCIALSLVIESPEWKRDLPGAPIAMTIRRGCTICTLRGVAEAVSWKREANPWIWLVSLRFSIRPPSTGRSSR